MKYVNKPLLSLEGKPLKQGQTAEEQKHPDAKDLTAFFILLNTALLPATTRQYMAPEQAARYELSLKLYRAMDAQEKGESFDVQPVDIESKLVAALQEDIVRIYGPLVAGQMIAYLEQQ